MLGTILIVILILALLGALPQLVAQPKLGLLPDRRIGTDPFHRCHSPGSRPDLNHAPSGQSRQAP